MAWSEIFTSNIQVFFAFGGLVPVLVFGWLVYRPRLALSFLFLSLAAGQLLRLPLPGQGGGVLLSDVAVVAVILAVWWRIIVGPSHSPRSVFGEAENSRGSRVSPSSSLSPAYTPSPYYQYGSVVCSALPRTRRNAKVLIGGVKVSSLFGRTLLLITPFVFWSLFTLVIRVFELGLNNSLIAFLYWARLTAVLFLLPSLLYLLRDKRLRWWAWRGWYASLLILALLGCLQLYFVSDLSPFVAAGWDPHQFRLVSTWMDPNFIGVLFAMGLISVLLAGRTGLVKRWLIGLLLAVCLVATQSRSSIVALVTALLFALPLVWCVLGGKVLSRRKLVVLSGGGLVVTLLLLVTVLLLPRFVDLVSVGPTVKERLDNIQSSMLIIEDNVWLGVGYNAYQFAAREVGIISDFKIHSRAGTDNSWLTLWATTGIVGVVLFLLPWLYVAGRLLGDVCKYGSKVSLVGLLSLLILFVHSMFINSFIYSHLLIALIVLTVLGVLECHGREGTNTKR